ncbi:MAG: hypothetical protein HYX69_00090 [Planctomycetia bacterium]|nr:hypothetical protein [Planctomycetia bacterium]
MSTDAQPKPRRRWSQFGLGTMFVAMTLLAIWMGAAVNKMHERQQLLRWAQSQGAVVSEYPIKFMKISATQESWAAIQMTDKAAPTPSLTQRLLGESPVTTIVFSGPVADAKKEALSRAFTKAQLVETRSDGSMNEWQPPVWGPEFGPTPRQ